MKLSEICVKRPVFTIVITLIPILLGFLVFLSVPVKFAPFLGQSTINISISGIDTFTEDQKNKTVIRPILNTLGSIKGITKTMSSSNGQYITLNVSQDVDIDDTVTKVNNQINQINDELPNGVSTVVSKSDSMGMPDEIIISEASNNIPFISFINQYKLKYPDLYNQINYVGTAVTLQTGYQNFIIKLNPFKLAYFHINIPEIIKQLREDIISDGFKTNYFNQTSATFKVKAMNDSIESLKETIIHIPDSDKTIFLKDIADVYQGRNNITDQGTITPNAVVNFQSKPNINGMMIWQSKDSKSNLLAMSNETEQLNQKLNQQNPAIKTYKLYSKSDTLKEVIHSVIETLIIAFILVVIVIYMFLGKVKATFIPLITVPTCLLSTILIIYVGGFSFDLFTLLALLLAIGLVVDDAIILVEAVDAGIERGMEPFEATFLAIKKVGFSIITMSLTLASVYIPLAFTNMITSPALVEFAVVLAGSVLVSAFVALTLTPMMCARLLSAKSNKITEKINQTLNYSTKKYSQGVSFVLSRRLLFISLVILGSLSLFAVIKLVTIDNLTIEKTGTYLVQGDLQGTNILKNERQKQFDQFVEVLRPFKKDYKRSILYVQDTHVRAVILTKDGVDQGELMKKITTAITHAGFKNAFSFPLAPIEINQSASSQEGSNQVSFDLQTSLGIQDLYNQTNQVKKGIKKIQGVTNVEGDDNYNAQIMSEFVINKDLVKKFGVTESDIYNVINASAGNYEFDRKIKTNDFVMPLYLSFESKYFNKPNDLYSLRVPGKDGKLIPLRSLGSFQIIGGPTSINMTNGIITNPIKVTFADGITYVEGMKLLEKNMPNTLPKGMGYAWTGQAETLFENSSSFGVIILASFVVIYLLLAAQFESFKDSFIVLFSVPLTLVLTLWCCYLAGVSINIYAILGLATLIGLTAKNGILITEYANQLLSQGKEGKVAIYEALKERFRPILMTSLVMIAGAIPLMFQPENIRVLMHDIGFVIAIGVTIGTICSLFVVPLMYCLIKRIKF